MRPTQREQTIVFKVLHYKLKLAVRIQYKMLSLIVHTMAGMCGMHKLYVCYLEHRR